MRIRSRCCVCEKPIADSFWVCADCGCNFRLAGSWAAWPDWARELRNAEQRRRRRRDNTPYPIPLGYLSVGGRAAIERIFYGDPGDSDASEG